MGVWGRLFEFPFRTPHQGASDTDLVRLSAAGDHQAFAQLHQRYGPMVHATLLSRLRPEDADDLVQEVFMTALQRLGDLRDGEAVGGWLRRIARNRAIDLLRRQRPTDEIDERTLGVDASSAVKVEAREALAAICALPEAYRETLLMRLVEGMTGPEIARKTGMTPGSVRVNLHRGMKLLRESLGEAPG